MKASGISLLKVMSPLIVLIAAIAIGAFFFQNNVLPKSQVKMWTLLFSMRQKSPELDIPEGVFYDQITGYNLFVKKKDRESGVLHDLMIYDMSSGFNNASIILADSGKMSFTADKKHLFLKLWQGESFENLQDQQISRNGVPYRRESFSDKEIMIPFDANFNKMDESNMRSQYIGKDIAELKHTIDSVNVRIDSIGNEYGNQLLQMDYAGVRNYRMDYDAEKLQKLPEAKKQLPIVNIDSLFAGKSLRDRQRYVSFAIDRATQEMNDFEFKSYSLTDDKKTIIRHQIEMQRKFTLSIACLIFFFIGAPLGAIIRKGGIGMPIVISVFLFIFYYIIDTAGFKLARDGRVEVWAGIWASSIVLFPLGIFLTSKAVNDSAVFKPEVYIDFFKKIFGKSVSRHVEMKEVIMDDVSIPVAFDKLEQLRNGCISFLQRYPKPQTYRTYWLKGFDRKQLSSLSEELEDVVAYLGNANSQLVINKLMDFPILKSLFFYYPVNNRYLAHVILLLFPIGLPCYLIGIRQQKQLKKEIKAIIGVCDELENIYKKEN